jgi:fucose permease
LAFLPIPLTVFAVSQLCTRVLLAHFPAKRLMLVGLVLSGTGMFIDSRLGTGTGYELILPSLLLFGAGNGISFVTLTGAALHGVDRADAGAASGLINVMQQLGAALGVAILVTVFGSATSHASTGATSPAASTTSSPEPRCSSSRRSCWSGSSSGRRLPRLLSRFQRLTLSPPMPPPSRNSTRWPPEPLRA